jgi:hypothetical protein
VSIANNYHEKLLFHINGVAHAVAPGMTKTVTTTAGELRYEVISERWGRVHSETTKLRPGETYSVRAD